MGGSGSERRGSMIEVKMIGVSPGFHCTNPLNRRWWNKVGKGDAKEVLRISFVVKILKWGVLKVDDSQGNELGRNGGGCCRVKNECKWSWGGER